MKITSWIASVCGLCFYVGAWAQNGDSLYTKRDNTWQEQKEKKVSVGGNLGLQFNPLFINLAPLLNYKMNDNLILGAGPMYIYSERTMGQQGAVSKKGSSIYGGRANVVRRLFKPLFLQAEAEALNYSYYISTDDKKREWVINPLAGLSYHLSLGKRTFFQITLLYNFNYYNHSFNQQLYNSPWVFRLGAGKH